MRPISNWENVKEMSGGFETLPAGGYVCRIRSVKEKPNKNNSGTHLEIMFDVEQGEYRGFFEHDYRAQTREDKFWRGNINQNIPDESSPKYEVQCSFFKSFINAVEESNNGYHWNWDEATLKDKLCGIVFGEREKQSQKGTVYTVTYADKIVSIDAITNNKFKVPEIKKLAAANNYYAPTAFSPVTSDDDDLPF